MYISSSIPSHAAFGTAICSATVSSAGDHDLITPGFDMQSENFPGHARESFNAVNRERGADRQPRRVRTGNDKLAAVIAIEFRGCVRQRRVVEHQHSTPPAE